MSNHGYCVRVQQLHNNAKDGITETAMVDFYATTGPDLIKAAAGEDFKSSVGFGQDCDIDIDEAEEVVTITLVNHHRYTQMELRSLVVVFRGHIEEVASAVSHLVTVPYHSDQHLDWIQEREDHAGY